MSWKICLPPNKHGVDGSRQICVLIPQLIAPAPITPNPPDPPFIDVPQFDQEQVRQLQSLVTIDQLAERLPPDMSQDFRRAVTSHMASLQQRLGPGIEVKRH
jgi:hypothetical protein